MSQQYEVSHQQVEDRLDGDPDQRRPSDPTGTEIVVEYYELEEEVLRVIGIEGVIVDYNVQQQYRPLEGIHEDILSELSSSEQQQLA